MPFEQAFRLSALLLATTAFAGLILAKSVPGWLALLTAAILTLTLLRTMGWGVRLPVVEGFSARPVLWNGLLVGAFALFLIDLALISRELLAAGVHFLVMLLAIKVATLHQRRDYRHLYAVCLMSILASAAMTTDLWYVSIFLLYLLVAVWTLLLYHLTGYVHRQHKFPLSLLSSRQVSLGHITSRFFWLTNGIALLTLVMTLGIFFVIPRISVGMMQKSRGEGLKTTGFSERVDLGMIGSVKEDPQIVMRVELPNQPAGGSDRLYLRGLGYDHYNGRSWSSSSRAHRNLGLFADGIFKIHSGGNRTPVSTPAPLRQDILLEPLDTSVLFAVPFAESVSGEFVGLQVDGMSGLHLPFPPSSRLRYSVTSRDHLVAADEQTTAQLDYPGSIRDHYLQLPPLSTQVAELARRIAGEKRTPYEQILAIHRHLITSYQYSLVMETAPSSSPIEDFLFKRKTGYCEHYATAMVVMLRSLGIPARLVTGFLATEWNDFGNYFTVRQRDAHAWVEVYYPRSGWVTMDPTPASTAAPSSSVLEALQRIGESLRLHWDRVFIRYSARDQLAVVYRLREGGDSVRDHLSQWVNALRASTSLVLDRLREHAPTATPISLWILLILAGSVVAIALVLLWVRSWSRSTAGSSALRKQQRIVHVYKKMLGIAAQHGVIAGPSMTPMEFVRRVNREWSEAGTIVAGLTTLYCRGRFSGSLLCREEMAYAVEQISALQHISRPTR